MKRKTAVCKCGRAVESKSMMAMVFSSHEGYVDDEWRYFISCPCGIKTREWTDPKSAWDEWRELQEANDGK